MVFVLFLPLALWRGFVRAYCRVFGLAGYASMQAMILPLQPISKPQKY